MELQKKFNKNELLCLDMERGLKNYWYKRWLNRDYGMVMDNNHLQLKIQKILINQLKNKLAKLHFKMLYVHINKTGKLFLFIVLVYVIVNMI